jgi:pimeloyl-ACP methyl ester carboxylesterase
MFRAILSRLPEGPPRPHPLLFVHGAWHGAWCWDDYVLPWFAERGYEAHAVDLRGHGASDNDRPLWRTRIDHYVEDVDAAVKRLDRPPVVIGHSMGGLVVQRYLEHHRMPGAVLVAPMPVGGAIGVTLRMARRHPLVLLRVSLTGRLWPVVGTARLAREHLFGDDMGPTEFRRHYARLQDESYLACLDMMMFRRPRPRRISGPVLVIAAGFDGLFTEADLRRTAAAYRTEPVTIPGAAHDLMLDARWAEMAAVVDEWVAGLPA